MQPVFAGVLLGIALGGLAWLAFHAAIDGALTARVARVSGHVQWLSDIVVLVWLLGLHTLKVAGFGQVSTAVVGVVLIVLGFGSVRLSSAVRRRERAKQTGAASADRVEKRASKKRETERVAAEPVEAGIRPAARAPDVTAINPVTGRTIDPVSGREIDPVTGKRIEPVISGDIDPATGRRVDPLTGRIAPDAANGAPR